MNLLEVRGLRKHFGGLVAINDLSFHIEKGGILGIIGPNGAGKTTVFNLITGVYSPTAGKVEFKGEDITGLRPSMIAEKGIVRTWQVTSLFANMTVLQNVIIGCHLVGKIGLWQAIVGGASLRKKEEDVQEKAMRILDLMWLVPHKDKLAKELSGGYQKALSLAIAFSANPELLLLDEPVTMLSQDKVEMVMGLVTKVRDAGTTVVVVEHNMKAIMDYCDRIFVLAYGKKIAEGLPQEIRENEEVIEAYLGTMG